MNSSQAMGVHGYAMQGGQVSLWQQAMATARRGQHATAAHLMAAILAAQPDFAPARVQMAYLQLAMDRYRDARLSALLAAQAQPRSAEFALELIRLLRRFEEIEQVASIVDRVCWADCRAAPLLSVAAELGPIGLYARALNLLDLADSRTPGLTQAQVLRGTIALTAGETGQARRLLRAALDSSGRPMPHVRWMLTLQPQREHLDADIADLERQLGRVQKGSEDEAYLYFGLHNLLHAAGRYAPSWEALQRGCNVKRRLQPYDRGREHALFDALESIKPRGAIMESTLARSGMPQVVFIVGMYRSGTSLLERILAGHSQVTDGGESYVFNAALRAATDHAFGPTLDAIAIERAEGANLKLAGQLFHEYARWRAAGRACFTEKLPSNFLNLGFILQALPEARVLHMRRDPADTCFSNLRTFFSGAAPYSYDQADLVDYYLRYRELMRHWHAAFPGRILDVDYQCLVDDPEQQARRILAFCGMAFEPAILDVGRSGGHSATASVASVRSGILKDRGRAWEPYAQHLQPLLDGLQ